MLAAFAVFIIGFVLLFSEQTVGGVILLIIGFIGFIIQKVLKKRNEKAKLMDQAERNKEKYD